MADTTKERPKIHSGKKNGKIKGLKKARRDGCGAWYFATFPSPPALTTPKKLIDKKVNTGLDTVIYFFPNPENACRNYAFVQFAKRSTTRLNADGSDSGQEIEGESHDWQPDIEDWEKRKVKKFLDLGEIIYNGKRAKRCKPGGMRRDDRPGFAHPPGRIPRNRKIRWEFKTYVICEDGAKVVGLLEFAFEITLDRRGKATLDFPDEGEAGFPSLTKTCCQVDDGFTDWIDQWHAHDDLKDLPTDPDKRREKLKEAWKLIEQAARGKRKFMRLFPKKRRKKTKPKKG